MSTLLVDSSKWPVSAYLAFIEFKMYTGGTLLASKT